MKPTKTNIARWVRAYGIAQDFDLENAEDMLAAFAEIIAPALPTRSFEVLLDRWRSWARIHKTQAERATEEVDKAKHTAIANILEISDAEVVAVLRHKRGDAEVSEQSEEGNRVYPKACKHVAAGELREIERLELDMRVITIDPPADYRYGKGPDTTRLCALCTGTLMGMLFKHDIFPKEG